MKVQRTFGARAKMEPVFYFAGRPEAVPYICPLGGYVRVGGDAYIAPPYTNGIFFYPAGPPEAVPYICALGGYVRVGGDALHRPALYRSTPHWGVLASPLGRGGSAER